MDSQIGRIKYIQDRLRLYKTKTKTKTFIFYIKNSLIKFQIAVTTYENAIKSPFISKNMFDWFQTRMKKDYC